MKNFQLFATIIIVVTAMAACSGGKKQNNAQHDVQSSATEVTHTTERQRPDWIPADRIGHTSEEVLDFFGTYEGVLPSASGMGIVTIVTLNEDRTFEMTRTYLRGDGGGEVVYEGNYTIEFGQIVVLDLGNGNEMFLDLREGALALLDNQMNRIEDTPFQPRYLLKMIDSGIIWH